MAKTKEFLNSFVLLIPRMVIFIQGLSELICVHHYLKDSIIVVMTSPAALVAALGLSIRRVPPGVSVTLAIAPPEPLTLAAASQHW